MRCKLFLFDTVIGETLGPSFRARFLRLLDIVPNNCCDLGTVTETFNFFGKRQKDNETGRKTERHTLKNNPEL